MSGLLPAIGGGAKLASLQVAAGALSGLVAMSGLIAAGVVPVRPEALAAKPLALIGCPDGGSVVAVAQPGEQMLVTARNADGSWLRVYVPAPVARDGWVPATSVELLADGSGLPVAGCSEVAAATGTPPIPTATLPPATPEPSVAATTATAAPTEKATAKPTPVPTPTPTPTPNVGPKFTAQPLAVVRTIDTNPIGSTTCTRPASTSIRAGVADPDGVSSVELWVRKPGASAYARIGRDFVKSGTTSWRAAISTKTDGLPTAGKLNFYAVASDAKGVKTKSKVGSLTITRCDSEADISGGLDLALLGPDLYLINLCTSSQQPIPWRLSVIDRDSLRTVKVSYVFTQDSGPKTSSGTVTLADVGGGYWEGSSATYEMQQWYGYNTVAWSVVTTDAYGGKTSRGHTDRVLSRYC